MALEDIERLKEKISKDPNSKLFVPLAEEYKKAGMLDEAIEVLTTGLENQPGYLSARVSLGKIFIDRGLLHEAQVEFEKVIGAIPDNLYAHKKLAEIYRDLGDKEKAVREFSMVLKLNPLDEWASTSLAEMEQTATGAAGGTDAVQTEEPLRVDTGGLQADYLNESEAAETGEPPFEEAAAEESLLEIAPEPSLAEEVAGFPDTAFISSEESGHGETNVPGLSLGGEELEEIPSGAIEELKEEEIPETPLSKEDLDIWKSHAESLKSAGGIEPEAVEEAEVDLWQPLHETHGKEEAQRKAGVEEVPLTVPEPADLPEDETLLFEGVPSAEETEDVGEAALVEEKAPGEGLTVDNADAYIAEGKYFSAMNIYRKMLSRDTGNRQVLQRVEELKVLLKLLGKDKEELVSRLDSFLDGIRKRHDEFSGNT